MSDEEAKLPFKLIIETLGEDELMSEATRLRVIAEGSADTITAIYAAIYELVGGGVVQALSYQRGGEVEDITAQYLAGPTRLDPLSTGDSDPEA